MQDASTCICCIEQNPPVRRPVTRPQSRWKVWKSEEEGGRVSNVVSIMCPLVRIDRVNWFAKIWAPAAPSGSYRPAFSSTAKRFRMGWNSLWKSIIILKYSRFHKLFLQFPYFGSNNVSTTQVGSPAVHLKLARYTAWVKRWSEAMSTENLQRASFPLQEQITSQCLFPLGRFKQHGLGPHFPSAGFGLQSFLFLFQ